MEKNTKNWHLSSETRYILVNLRDAIQHNLEMDEKGNASDFSNYWSLLPWIYKAFMKIWCRKFYCVRKSCRSSADFSDTSKVLVSLNLFARYRSAYCRELNRENSSGNILL